ncbi:Mu transposase C-terminal domain-containing protein [Saccharopolyspora shandongensis]|uniref:Mu transposase C-terminal domain-containing protein n=1 Tax=Saccharopolyspora shandongensis TaxID=418495 RepID=UPI0033E9C4D3
MRLAARAVGVTNRTVYRWLKEGAAYARPPSPRRFCLSETDVMAYEDFRGNTAAVYRARCAAVAGETTVTGVPIAEHLLAGWRGAEQVAERTFYAAIARELTPGEQAYWRHGEKARRNHRVYGQRSGLHRNEVWQVDHTQLEIVVVPPRGKPLKPWLTTFVDHSTRVIMGWAIALRPDAGVVVSALRMALVCDPDAGGFGGVPAVIECDQGREFSAKAVARPAATLSIVVRPVEAYEGRGKGVIERWHKTIEKMFLCQLPGYTGGPRDKRGRLYGPVRDDASWRKGLPEVTAKDQSPVALPITALAYWFGRWVHWFNTEHQHEGIGGRPPLQAWKADPTPVAVIESEQLRDLLLVSEDATIISRGIRHQNMHYWAPELNGRVGEKVDLRYAPHDDRFLEVYSDGKHLATAHPTDAASPEESEAHRQSYQQETRRLAARRRRASARARRRIEPLTQQAVSNAQVSPGGGSPGEQTTAPEPAAETRLVAKGSPRPASTRVRGSSSLLGLHDPLATRRDGEVAPSGVDKEE